MTATTPEQAQRSLDRFCETIADQRLRAPGRLVDPNDDYPGRGWPTVAELAAAEPLMALPAACYPATVEESASVADNSTVAFRGNRYAVAPGLRGAEMLIRHRLGSPTLEIHSQSGLLLATHKLQPEGLGRIVRSAEHKAALEAVVLGSFTTSRPCQRKGNFPPGAAARGEAQRLLAVLGPEVQVDLEAYARLVEGMAGDE